jgi:hypothetical protein
LKTKWKPNSLNWPKYVNKRVSRAVSKVLEMDQADNNVPEFMKSFIGMDERDYPSIRSCVTAPEGWCFTESDLDTAEVKIFLRLT